MLRLVFVIALFCGLHGPAVAQSSDPDRPLQVLIKQVAPFVQRAQDGTLSGFSIDLWRALETQLGVTSEFVMLPDLATMLVEIEAAAGDVAIAAITITSEREQRMDFSHPFFRSGLQIMVRNTEMTALAKAVSFFTTMFKSPSIRIALVVLLVLVLGTAHVVWLVERRKNPDFTRSYPMGLWDGVYWTMATISTVGYGDKTTKSHPGRVIALMLMVFGYIAFAWFTATVSSSMTVDKLESDIQGPQDLAGKVVATVAGSTSESYLFDLQNVQVQSVSVIEDAYQVLMAQQVDAVVFDYAVLSYFARGQGHGKVRLTGAIFQRELYGLVFATGSVWRERVNQALLQLGETGKLSRLHQKWFGTPPN